MFKHNWQHIPPVSTLISTKHFKKKPIACIPSSPELEENDEASDFSAQI